MIKSNINIMNEIDLLPGVKIIKADLHKDHRGLFYEIFSNQHVNELKHFKISQVNYVHSSLKNTLRGLHLQKGSFAQGKILTCLHGSIIDVIVDVNPDSRNFRKYCKVEISSVSKSVIFIPKGYAHGYLTLTDNVEVIYLVDNEYNQASEITIKYDDASLNIDWGVNIEDLILSFKDKNGINLTEMEEWS
jgi:dTDP-4-dehydrorhamnose 3,5-epimerase